MQLTRNVPPHPTNNARPAPVDMRTATVLARALNGDAQGLPPVHHYVPAHKPSAGPVGIDHNQARAYMDHVEMTANSLLADGFGRAHGLTLADLRKLSLQRLMALQAEHQLATAQNAHHKPQRPLYDLNTLEDLPAGAGMGPVQPRRYDLNTLEWLPD